MHVFLAVINPNHTYWKMGTLYLGHPQKRNRKYYTFAIPVSGVTGGKERRSVEPVLNPTERIGLIDFIQQLKINFTED